MLEYHVLQTAVGAAADHNLIDLDVLALAGKVGVLGQVGVADGGLQLVQIDLQLRVVPFLVFHRYSFLVNRKPAAPQERCRLFHW